ncbi:acyl carrier protein [Roseateles amylovorans]|uniref:Acyl carrier protein n=1 Tax=Roseateles amylovorans TaxID=2978473 RepID=A0ABY6B3V4_9BURK|nr:acyl carrier protein [Roseateles amylovorans]UXH79229.1 acyl carrier protein [Roseateles amylovorans]
MSNMLEPLRQLACRELGLTENDLDSTVTFAELGLDSLMLVDFMFAVEDHFHIQIDHDEAMKTPTLTGLAALVERLVAAAPADTSGTPKVVAA